MKNNYKLKIICLLCVVTAAFSSCKKNELAKEKSLTNNHNTLAGFGRDGKNDLLGYGYNVLGEFANASAATLPVIDVDKLQADQSTRIVYDGSTRTDGKLEAGSDAVSYLKKLTTRFSSTFGADFLGMSLFRATVTGTFNNTDIFSSKNIYSSYNFLVQQKRVKLNAQRDVLLSYLDPEFLSYIQNQTPEAIVNRYGTHILADIILGGKLDVRYQSETSKSDKTLASSAGVDLHVKKIFNINTGFTNDANYVIENFNQKLHYTTNGGDPTRNLIGDIVLGNSSNPNPTPTINITAWQNSCTLENSVLIDIPNNGLLPIYDFIPDQAKALAVKNYIIQYLTDNQGKLIDEPAAPPVWYPSASVPMFTLNQAVYTANRQYYLHLQNDGNLVLVKASNGQPLWATNKSGGSSVFFEPDGNLLVFNSTNNMIWASNVYFRGQDYSNSKDLRFVFQDDGNLVLQLRGSVVTATGTGGGIVSSHFGRF